MNPENPTPEFILSEVKKLQYLYGLKHEIRYGQSRPEGDLTESVAEHIYGMHLLALYFLPLEDPERKWDALKIFSMITVHDLDEIETGDTIGYLKTARMREEQHAAKYLVINNSPIHLQSSFKNLIEEYEAQASPEARFVKAIDRFEPLIQTYTDFGRTIISLKMTTPEETNRIKEPYIQPFPIMYAFNQVVHKAMIDEGYFHHL